MLETCDSRWRVHLRPIPLPRQVRRPDPHREYGRVLFRLPPRFLQLRLPAASATGYQGGSPLEYSDRSGSHTSFLMGRCSPDPVGRWSLSLPTAPRSSMSPMSSSIVGVSTN